MDVKVTNKALAGSHDRLNKFVASVFKIIPRGRSQFVKDGTGPEFNTKSEYLSTNRLMFLECISRLFLGNSNGYMPTQYIVGADTIYINDYFEDKEGRLVLERVTAEQAKAKGYIAKKGLRSQGYEMYEEYKRVTLDKPIYFEFGILDVRSYGDDPILLRFIEEHEQNENAPRAKENKDRKRLKLFQFGPSIPELDAAKSDNVSGFDSDLAAMLLVAKTRTKTTDGYVYHEKWLDTILAIIEDGKTLVAGEVLQKFDIVCQWSNDDSAEFLRITNEAFNDAKIDIQLAEKLKVINFGAKDVHFVDGGAKRIIEFEKPSGDKEALVEELMLFLLGSKEGQVYRSEITRLTEVAKLNAM